MKSSFSTGNSNCVGVDPVGPSLVRVFNTKVPAMVLAFNRDEWDAFVRGVQAGEFEWDKIQASAGATG